MGQHTDRYNNASNAYQDAMNKYAGIEGWKLALEQSKDYANVAGDVARGSGYKAARTAGWGKAASYALANDSANNAINSNLQSGMTAALNNNSSTMNNYGTNAQNNENLDKMKYQQERDSWGIGLQTGGQLLSAFSDERLKDICSCSEKEKPNLTIDWLNHQN